MLNKYYVQILSLNQSGGNSQEIKPYSDFRTAEAKYCDALSSYCGNKETGYCVISIVDPYGRIMPGYTFTINHLPEPTPPESEETNDGE